MPASYTEAVADLSSKLAKSKREELNPWKENTLPNEGREGVNPGFGYDFGNKSIDVPKGVVQYENFGKGGERGVFGGDSGIGAKLAEGITKQDEASAEDSGKEPSSSTTKMKDKQPGGEGFDIGKFIGSPVGMLAMLAVGRAIAGKEAERTGSDLPIFDYARGAAGFLEGKTKAEQDAKKLALEREKAMTDRMRIASEKPDNTLFTARKQYILKMAQDPNFMNDAYLSSQLKGSFTKDELGKMNTQQKFDALMNASGQGIAQVWQSMKGEGAMASQPANAPAPASPSPAAISDVDKQRIAAIKSGKASGASAKQWENYYKSKGLL